MSVDILLARRTDGDESADARIAEEQQASRAREFEQSVLNAAQLASA